MASRDTKKPLTVWLEDDVEAALRAKVERELGDLRHPINRKKTAVTDTVRRLIDAYLARPAGGE